MEYEGLSIERINHDCFKIKGSKVVYIDPFQVGNVDDKADLVLITHEHYDHCSPSDVERVSDENTVIVTVADCQSKLSGLDIRHIALAEPGKKIKIEGMLIEAVPAYNINKFRSPGVPYHPKENQMVGYILTLDGKRIYHAGDTDAIPEMEGFENIDVALLPVSGTYVMTAMEAAEACNKIKPKLAIPMHYGAIVGTSGDAMTFKQRASCRVEII